MDQGSLVRRARDIDPEIRFRQNEQLQMQSGSQTVLEGVIARAGGTFYLGLESEP